MTTYLLIVKLSPFFKSSPEGVRQTNRRKRIAGDFQSRLITLRRTVLQLTTQFNIHRGINEQRSVVIGIQILTPRLL